MGRLSRDVALALAAFAVAAVLLTANTVHHSARLSLSDETTDGRYWEEMNIAVQLFHHREYPVASYEVEHTFFSRDPRARAFREALARETAAAGVRPWQFWRAIGGETLLGPHRHIVLKRDDRGRVLALAAAFRLLGGVAPYLLFWLGLLAALPVLLWTAIELGRSGRPVAAVAFLPLVGASPFVAETLALAYSGVGFYVVTALALVPLAAYATSPRPTPRGLLVRVALAGLTIALVGLCRRASLLLLPGYALALLVALWRLEGPAGRLRRVVVGLPLAMVLLVGPLAAATAVLGSVERATAARYGTGTGRPRHSLWLNLWEGLGDFDRTKGYVWSDKKAMQAAIDEVGEERLLSARTEKFFRNRILRDIREDPGWYAGILLRRLFATFAQRKLWPRAAGEGETFAPSTAPNEGVIDSYYSLATTVDVVGVGPLRVELPGWLLPLPTLALLLVWLRGGAGRDPLLLAPPAAALLVVPVALSTASALETQAFAFVHALALGVLAQRLADRH